MNSKWHFKKISIHILLTVCAILGATFSRASTYYISSSTGNDAYNSEQAQNIKTPWKSIEKLNAYFSNLKSGDSVLFKRGEVFYGSIVVRKSGGVFAPIIISAYGQGKQPEITGFSKLNSWKAVKKGIYESPCAAIGYNVVINGKQQVMGRYPNTGYLSYQHHNGNLSITDNQLTGLTNWTGAELVIRKNRWIIDKSTITQQSNGTFSYSSDAKSAMPTSGFGYFIQNDIKTLDQFGEWYYDRTNSSMLVYLGTQNPSSLTVKASTINNLVEVQHYSYINFEDLQFTGAGNNTFNIVKSKNIVIKSCTISLGGSDAVFVSYSPFVNIQDCTINHMLNNGFNLDDGCTNALMINNVIKNIGLIPGMGKSGSGTYEAITSFGDNAKIAKNRIDSIGYDGIYFGGNSSIAKNNYITYFCLTKDDGAGIYIGDWAKTTNKKVIENIVLHGVGNNSGAGSSKSLQAEGIYIDDNSESVVINNNTVSLCANNGIKIHNAKDIVINNNTLINNGIQFRMEQDHYLATSTFIRNNQVRNNTFYSLNNSQHNAKFTTQQDDIEAFGQIDSNYYSKQERSNILASIKKNGLGVNQIYNLTNWKSAYGKDQFSKELPASTDVLFDYNTAESVKTIVLNQTYVDLHHNIYNGVVHLNPYSSIILIPANEKSPITRAEIVSTVANNNLH